MAFRSLTYYCRIGHILAQPKLITSICPTKIATAPLLMNGTTWGQRRYQSSDNRKTAQAKCGERFKQAPCDQKTKEKSAIKEAKIPALSVKEQEIKLIVPEQCCGNPCKDAVARFDMLYYRRSDKLNREYQQTWAECPELIRKPKVICSYENVKFPQLEKRSKAERPQTACKQVECTNAKSACPSLRLPRCGKARRPPKCHVNRSPMDCVKRKAPYPSFTECSRQKLKLLHPIECKCLALPTMCDVWAEYHKKKIVKSGWQEC